MTDKEIALALEEIRWWSSGVKDMQTSEAARCLARSAVRGVHHIINSINWED